MSHLTAGIMDFMMDGLNRGLSGGGPGLGFNFYKDAHHHSDALQAAVSCVLSQLLDSFLANFQHKSLKQIGQHTPAILLPLLWGMSAVLGPADT